MLHPPCTSNLVSSEYYSVGNTSQCPPYVPPTRLMILFFFNFLVFQYTPSSVRPQASANSLLVICGLFFINLMIFSVVFSLFSVVVPVVLSVVLSVAVSIVLSVVLSVVFSVVPMIRFHIKSTFRGRKVSSAGQVPRVPRGELSVSAHPRLRPAALSGVNCTSCVKPLRGLAHWDYRLHFALTHHHCKLRPVGPT